MNTKLFSFLAVLFFCLTPTASALRVQSQAVPPLRVSQLTSSPRAPLEIHGKIWGNAPKGEVTHIRYSIVDDSGATTWERIEPYAQVFTGTEDLDILFTFDLTKALVDENARLMVQLQKQTMNGAFSQVMAQGSMGLVFSNTSGQQKEVSRIEQMTSFVDAKNIVVQTQFKNLNEEGKFYAKAKLFNEQGVLIQEIDSVKKPILTGGTAEFSSLFTLPDISGRYKTEVQIFEDDEAATGAKKQSIIVAGEFAIISSLSVTPESYFYAGEVATFQIQGTSSSWGMPLTLDLTVIDATDTEIFSKEFPVQTNEIGKFSETIGVPIYKETPQLQTKIELRRGTKVVGSYDLETQKVKKPHATEGQSTVSFAVERMSQDFLFGGAREKAEIIISFLILIGLLVGFVFFVQHIRKAHLVLLLCACCLSGITFADFTYPTDGWIANPSPNAFPNDSFATLFFKGTIDDLILPEYFPVNEDISVDVNLGGTVVPWKFQTTEPTEYSFLLPVPNNIQDGTYTVELVMRWPEITLPGGTLEIDLLVNPVAIGDDIQDGDRLSIVIDKTPPALSFAYFSGNNDVPLAEDAFSKDPIDVYAMCDDPTGCLFDKQEQEISEKKFTVEGNFCSDTTICPQNAVDDFVACDRVGNCATQQQIEIDQYDPIAPSLDGFGITQLGEGGLNAIAEEPSKIKAVASYIFSFFNLDDPSDAEGVFTDETACGENDERSPFTEYNNVCREKEVQCLLSFEEADPLGVATYLTNYVGCFPECPEGYRLAADLTCEAIGCNHVSFPFCFEWILDGKCETFPFCFDWFLH